MILVQSDAIWHKYDDWRIQANSPMFLSVSKAATCHFTMTNTFAFMTFVLPFLLPYPICLSPPPSSPFYLFMHGYLIPQYQPQSSALWRVPRQDPVTPSMTSWFSLRSVSWKPMESKPSLFISFYPLLQQIGDLFPLNIGALAFIAPIISPFPATSLLWWTTEEGCPATARSSYIRSDHRLSSFLDLMIREFVLGPSYEVKSNKKRRKLKYEPWIGFLLICVAQGIQRRITVTIAHEGGNDFEWKEVKELVIGERWSQHFKSRGWLAGF